MCLENISVSNQISTLKTTELNSCMYDFPVDYKTFDTSNIIDIHKYFIQIFGLIKKMYNGLLASIVSTSNQTKCMSLSSQKYMVQPPLINLYLNEYIYELYYYPFAV